MRRRRCQDTINGFLQKKNRSNKVARCSKRYSSVFSQESTAVPSLSVNENTIIIGNRLVVIVLFLEEARNLIAVYKNTAARSP